MTPEQFDNHLKDAARGANFGPLNGFGGQGSKDVFDNLPKPLQELFDKWKLPRQILAGHDVGKDVRYFAERCGINVTSDLSKLHS